MSLTTNIIVDICLIAALPLLRALERRVARWSERKAAQRAAEVKP